ncbi:MAG TPA: hypothetical protein VM432_11705, partial [Bdellovibrionales bacterium]|nr:hypothetical protein [Bdellovibrionales bacterium]
SQYASAAKDTPTPNFDDSNSAEPKVAVDPAKQEAVDIAPAPKAKPNQSKPDFFYRYRNGISPLLGFAFDTKANDDGSGTVTILGIRYLFASETLSAYELGAELLSNGSGTVHAGKRWDSSRSRFRPYTTAGLGMRIVPKDQVATVLRKEHVQLRGGAGFEYLSLDPISTRVEFGAIATLKSFQAQVLLGMNWAW